LRTSFHVPELKVKFADTKAEPGVQRSRSMIKLC
jgi:hypothetical protein